MTQDTARPKEITVTLGDQEVTVGRIKTQGALYVGQALIKYLGDIKDPLQQIMAAKGSEEQIDAGLALIERIGPLLGDGELLRFLSSLIGQDPLIVADAPLDDTLNAVAAAFEVNDISSYMSIAERIGQSFRRPRVSGNSQN